MFLFKILKNSFALQKSMRAWTQDIEDLAGSLDDLILSDGEVLTKEEVLNRFMPAAKKKDALCSDLKQIISLALEIKEAVPNRDREVNAFLQKANKSLDDVDSVFSERLICTLAFGTNSLTSEKEQVFRVKMAYDAAALLLTEYGKKLSCEKYLEGLAETFCKLEKEASSLDADLAYSKEFNKSRAQKLEQAWRYDRKNRG